MKIALCHYSCPPHVGGIESLVEQQALALKRDHHFVKVIAGAGNKFSPDIDVDINPMLSSGIMGMYWDRSMNDQEKMMEPQVNSIMEFLEYSLASFDLLIVHNVLVMPYNLPLTHAILRIAQKGAVKVVSWNHDSLFFDEAQRNACPASWEVLRHASPYVRYVCTTQDHKQSFEELYGRHIDIAVIPCGISIADFIRLQSVTYLLMDEKRLYETDMILLHPAMFRPDKNIEFSIEVIKALIRKGVNAVLLLTAVMDPHDPVSVECHDRIKRILRRDELSGQVLFVSEFVHRHTSSPVVSTAVLRDLYKLSDILIMPNIRNGYGTSLLEAAISRLPIACSDIPGFRRLLGDNGCMFALEEGPDVAAEKICLQVSACIGSIFRMVFRDYNSEHLYRTKMLPLLQDIMRS